MKRVLVTSAEGFIGKNVCRFLEKNSYEVLTLDKDKSSQEYRHVQLDIPDFSISTKLQELRLNVVVHLAAQIDGVRSAISLAIEKPTNGRVNISSGKEVSLLELFRIISRELNSEIIPDLTNRIVGEVERNTLYNSKAFNLLGWAPAISLEEVIKNSLAKKEIRA